MKYIPVLALGIILAGCVAKDFQVASRPQANSDPTETNAVLHIGMTFAEVETLKGKPNRIDAPAAEFGTMTYIYGRTHLHFVRGILKEIKEQATQP